MGALLAMGAVAGTALAADHAVGISGSAYAPANVTVAVGDTVTWTNSDQISHTATADGGSFDTGTLGNGASGSATFASAGTFPYHCLIHPDMTGTVVVEAASSGGGGSGGGTTTQPPTDTTPAKTMAPTASSGSGVAVLLVIGAFALGFAIAGRRFTRS